MVVAAVSAAVLVLGAPAFVLAIGVERYVRARLEKVWTNSKEPDHEFRR